MFADGRRPSIHSTDLAAAHVTIIAQREQPTLEIERLKLMLAKARRERQSSERGKLLAEQLELAIDDLEETRRNSKSMPSS